MQQHQTIVCINCMLVNEFSPCGYMCLVTIDSHYCLVVGHTVRKLSAVEWVSPCGFRLNLSSYETRPLYCLVVRHTFWFLLRACYGLVCRLVPLFLVLSCSMTRVWYGTSTRAHCAFLCFGPSSRNSLPRHTVAFDSVQPKNLNCFLMQKFCIDHLHCPVCGTFVRHLEGAILSVFIRTYMLTQCSGLLFVDNAFQQALFI